MMIVKIFFIEKKYLLYKKHNLQSFIIAIKTEININTILNNSKLKAVVV